MSYSKYLVDSIGNQHKRKNQYILDLINSSPEEKKKIIANKNSHPYIVKLNEFKKLENEFLASLKNEDKSKFDDKSSKKISEFKKRLFVAEKKAEFYKSYIDMSYDAELEYKTALLEIRHIPEIIKNDENLRERLANREKDLANIDPKKREEDLKVIEEKVKERKVLLAKEMEYLKEKYTSGLISKKAFKTEKTMKKRSYEEDVASISYIDDKKSFEEEIKNIKHHLKIDIETSENVLESDISDIRRKIPIEVMKTKPINSYLTFLFPGLGQLLNGQVRKAVYFAFATLFIYLAALPYALGFGNYRGEGIAGLISLAEGGKKLDKSIIFMIEGVLALVLVSMALVLLYISFKDVLSVEKSEIKGIRKRNWFETKQVIENEGFPYLVSTPALILVIFIVLIPIITALLISFTNMDPSHQNKFNWIGLENYKLIFAGKGVAGKAFWLILVWTFIWTFGATTLAIAIGFSLSLIANQERIKGKAFFRTVYLLPWAVPAFITIMFFSQMLSKNGPITELIAKVFGVTLDIKNNTTLTRISLILLQGWLGSAYVFLLSTGILQGIPKDLYEAAEIDGATGFQRTWRITIPLVLFQTAPLLIGQYTFNFNNFSIIHLFNGGGPFDPQQYGNLAGSSDLLISYIYKLTIVNNYQAIGAGISIIISLVLMFFAYIGFKNTKAFKEE